MAHKRLCAKKILWVMMTFSIWISTWNVAHRPKYQARRKISPLTYFGRLKGIKILKNDTNLFQFPGWTPKNINYIFLSIFGFKHHSLLKYISIWNTNYQFSKDQMHIISCIERLCSSSFIHRTVIELVNHGDTWRTGKGDTLSKNMDTNVFAGY